MRASRLIEMIVMLQNRGRITASQFAEEFEVSNRTVFRDVDALSQAGVPIVARRGATGGIELLSGFQTRLTGLTDDEVEALGIVLQGGEKTAGALGLGAAAKSMRLKILNSLPEVRREQVRSTADRFELEAPLAREIDSRVTHLADAIRKRQVVYVGLSSATRELHPLALSWRSDEWRLKALEAGVETEILVRKIDQLRVSNERRSPV